MQEYAFATVKHGEMAERINEWAEKGFSVDSWEVQGNHFYVLLYKWGLLNEDEDISDSDELWMELTKATERIALLEGALALKIRSEEEDKKPEKAVEEVPAE